MWRMLYRKMTIRKSLNFPRRTVSGNHYHHPPRDPRSIPVINHRLHYFRITTHTNNCRPNHPEFLIFSYVLFASYANNRVLCDSPYLRYPFHSLTLSFSVVQQEVLASNHWCPFFASCPVYPSHFGFSNSPSPSFICLHLSPFSPGLEKRILFIVYHPMFLLEFSLMQLCISLTDRIHDR